jgi:hypothetical protein
MTDKLLQGEKFSSAAYAGAKTGATAYAAGQIGQALKGKPEGTPTPATSDHVYGTRPGENELVGQTGAVHSGTKIAGQWVTPGQPLTDQQIAVMKISMDQGNSYPPEIMSQFSKQVGAGNASVTSGVVNAAASGTRVAQDAAFNAANTAVKDAIASGQINNYNDVLAATDKIMSTAGQTITPMGRDFLEKQVRAQLVQSLQGGTNESIKLSTNQINEVFHYAANAIILEGVWDTIKNKAATVGKNLTTKVTADKLNTAWMKAGSPTDSAAVAKILQDAGVDTEIISSVYKSMSLPEPAGAVSPTADVEDIDSVVDQIKKLPPQDQQKIMAYLKTNIAS